MRWVYLRTSKKVSGAEKDGGAGVFGKGTGICRGYITLGRLTLVISMVGKH
jgi:hypothetical protein